MEHETPLRYALAVAITTNKKEQSTKEPRWLAIIAMLASGLLYAALPSSLSVGPDWMLLAVLAALMVSTVISHRVGHHRADKTIGYAASGILTLAMIWSLGLLVAAIPKHEIEPKILLRSAVALWVTNILVFALWYWRLDAGNTSTALSPADTPALSRWAKILMMIQATISLAVLALLAARAVNIL